ncbi:hypothetical protein [Methylobacterium sp. Leaf106]|uniref:hypothetical protein n=1 Tax=Methylobacterium sp. Leaf106 TaxID=1736255 RepID=UPI0006F5AA44|nr:hypothetical protein [Methylobacterium sp. Leaf106]KQP53050.1 hypothetical protein ASF34_01385 [Methylobacterium sp. Leaf106]
MGDRKLSDLSAPEFSALIDARRQRRMGSIDDLSPAMRKLVNEYGFYVVRTLLDLGIKEPRHVSHIVETILDEFSPTRGSKSTQGVRTQLTRDDLAEPA